MLRFSTVTHFDIHEQVIFLDKPTICRRDLANIVHLFPHLGLYRLDIHGLHSYLGYIPALQYKQVLDLRLGCRVENVSEVVDVTGGLKLREGLCFVALHQPEGFWVLVEERIGQHRRRVDQRPPDALALSGPQR